MYEKILQTRKYFVSIEALEAQASLGKVKICIPHKTPPRSARKLLPSCLKTSGKYLVGKLRKLDVTPSLNVGVP